MSTPKTIQELKDERALRLNEIDDILRTAKEAEKDVLEDAERSKHDELVQEVESLSTEIESATVKEGDAERFSAQEDRKSRYSTVNINKITSAPASAERSLDELLNATAEDVPAGSYDKTGAFRQHYNARVGVDQVAVRSRNDEVVDAPPITEFRPEDRQVIRSFQKTEIGRA